MSNYKNIVPIQTQADLVLTDVWDRDNHVLKAIAGGAPLTENSVPIATMADLVLNDVWNPATNSLNISGGGGGVPTQFAIGGAVEVNGLVLPTTATALSLDPNGPNTSVYWLSGLTPNGGLNGWTVVTKGRYRIFGIAHVIPDATTNAVVQMRSSVNSQIGLDGFSYIDHRTTVYPQEIRFDIIAEIDVGTLIQFFVWIPSSAPPSLTLQDSYFWVQYVGPTVSI